MKKSDFCLINILFICLCVLLISPKFSFANIELYDGRLILNGFVKEVAYYRTSMTEREDYYHDNNLAFLQTSALFETLYTVKDEDDLRVRLFAGFKYWWQKAQYFDDDMDRSLPHRDKKDWVRPRSFDDDILTEAYMSVEAGPFELRLGKQIVVWGSLDLAQVTDVVNPPDFRRGYPGINTWEEIKQGVWMVRLLYQSRLPGDLLFELIFNPGDYKQVKINLEGTWPGAKAWSGRFFDRDNQEFGIFHWNREKWTRDAPGFNTSNWEAGFRIRGFTYGIDWTFIYWNARADDWVAHPDRIGSFSWGFIQAGLLTAMTGRTVSPPDWGEYEKVYYAKRYQMIGGTFERYCPEIWNTVWIIEWALDFGHPINKAVNGNSADTYGWTRRNMFDIAIKVQKALDIPWFTKSKIACGRMLDIAITYQWDKVLDHDHDDVVDTRWHRYRDSVADNVTLYFKQDMFYNRLVLVFVGNYYFKCGRWQAIPSLSYALPGVHWRIEGGYAAYGGKQSPNINYSSSNDSIFARIRYEF